MSFDLKTEIDVALTHLFGAICEIRNGSEYQSVAKAIDKMLELKNKYVVQEADCHAESPQSDAESMVEADDQDAEQPIFVEDVVAKVHKDKTITLEPMCKKQMQEIMYLAAFLTKHEWEKVSEAIRITHIQQSEIPPEKSEYTIETHNRIRKNFLRMFQNGE